MWKTNWLNELKISILSLTMLPLLTPDSVHDLLRYIYLDKGIISTSYIQSIEQKQIAQQQAQQAVYTVEEAKQTKLQKIVAAEGEAER